MGNPVLSNNSSVGIKKESTPLTRESLASGASFLDLIEEDVQFNPQELMLPTPIGDRQALSGNHIISHRDGRGSFKYRPRGADINGMLILLLGDAADGYNIPVVDGADLDMFTIECDKFGVTEYALAGCKVDSLEIDSEQNGPLEFIVEFIGASGEEDPGDLTAPDYTAWNTETPFMHKTMTFDATGHSWLGGASGPPVRKFNCKVMNNLDSDGFTNSSDRKVIPVGEFKLEGSLEIPYNATSAGFLTDWAAAGKIGFTQTWKDLETPVNTFEIQIVAKLLGDLPKASSGGAHQWLTVNFTGVSDATDPYMIKAKYTEGS